MGTQVSLSIVRLESTGWPQGHNERLLFHPQVKSTWVLKIRLIWFSIPWEKKKLENSAFPSILVGEWRLPVWWVYCKKIRSTVCYPEQEQNEKSKQPYQTWAVTLNTLTLAAHELWPNECQPFSVTNSEGFMEERSWTFHSMTALGEKSRKSLLCPNKLLDSFPVERKTYGNKDSPEKMWLIMELGIKKWQATLPKYPAENDWAQSTFYIAFLLEEINSSLMDGQGSSLGRQQLIF